VSDLQELRPSRFRILNNRDSVVEGSVQLRYNNGRRFDQWKFSVNTGDITEFTANLPIVRSFFIIVDVDRPEETTHETTELTESNDYQIEIKPNDIRVLVLT
jgi:hypothetical protein